MKLTNDRLRYAELCQSQRHLKQNAPCSHFGNVIESQKL